MAMRTEREPKRDMAVIVLSIYLVTFLGCLIST